MSFLINNAGTILTAAVLLLAVFLVAGKMIRDRRAGKGCCGSSCACCGAGCANNTSDTAGRNGAAGKAYRDRTNGEAGKAYRDRTNGAAGKAYRARTNGAAGRAHKDGRTCAEGGHMPRRSVRKREKG